MRICSALLPALRGVVVLTSACNDSTRPRPRSPLIGQWQLTTHFDEFTFETAAPSPPDCPGYTMYCTHHRATTDGAYLAGLIEIEEPVAQDDTVSTTVNATGMVETRFCDEVDYSYVTAIGCLHVGDLESVAYTGQITGTPDSATTGSLDVVIGEPSDVFGGNITLRSYDATFAGDSIYGAAYWGQSGGRSPPTYRGTFVLRRVH